MKIGKVQIKLRWIVMYILLAVFLLYPLPYYYSGPGSALALDEIIHVEERYEEQGAFMLTTVKMGRATGPLYIWAKFNRYQSLIPIKQLQYDGETDEQYHERQLLIMKQSQEAAKIVAYKQANQQVSITEKGVRVTDLIEGMPASTSLQIGDIITEVDQTAVNNAQQFMELLQGKTAEDQVSVTFIRDDEIKMIELSFAPFPKELRAEDDRVGIGIVNPLTERELLFNPEIKINTSQIGGPSAGLMFSLEIYNQLTEEDLTAGFLIAGTGTIDEDGNVGPIGGADQKVVAAHKAGADYFLAPVGENYEAAVQAAKQIKTSMEIIPVETFSEAVQFLQTL